MTKLTATIAVLAALTCSAGAFYWERGLGSSVRVSKASPPAPVPGTAAIPEKAAWSGQPVPSKVAEPTRDASASSEATMPLRAGEVLEFAADVGQLRRVA